VVLRAGWRRLTLSKLGDKFSPTNPQ